MPEGGRDGTRAVGGRHKWKGDTHHCFHNVQDDCLVDVGGKEVPAAPRHHWRLAQPVIKRHRPGEQSGEQPVGHQHDARG